MATTRKSASVPAAAAPATEGDDFDSILAAAEASIAARTSDLQVEEQVVVVKGEIVTPTTKETTPVKPTKKSTALATKPVTEPSVPSIRETMSFGGISVPFTVDLSDRSLSELEVVVEKGLKIVFAVGEALTEINARQLYREVGFTSFEKYLADRWGMSKARGYQAIKAADTRKKLIAAGVDPKDVPTTEFAIRQAEGVANKAPQDAVAVIAKAKELGGGTATAASIQQAASTVGQGRAASTTNNRVRSNTSAPGSTKPAATPSPAGTASGLEPVRVEEGREMISRMQKALMNGTFVRNDNDKFGTVARMRTLRKYIESWLAGTGNSVKTIDKRIENEVDRAIATGSTVTVPASSSQVSEAPVMGGNDRRSDESGEDFAKRVVQNETSYPSPLVEWARGQVAKLGLVVAAPAPEVAPEAKALMAATKAARPKTGTEQRRAAEKATAEVVAVVPTPTPAAAKPAAKARASKSKAA